MPKFRIPLAVPTVPRNSSSLDKDASLSNAYLDKSKSGTVYVSKRPGFYVGTEGITTGLNRGIFYNPNNPNNGGVFPAEPYGTGAAIPAGEQMVWYINSLGQLYTTSVPTEAPEPSEEELIFSGDMSIVTEGSETTGGAMVASSTDGLSGVTAVLSITPKVEVKIVLNGVEDLIYENAGLEGNYRITKTEEFFYVYYNGGLVATANYVFTGYSSFSTLFNVTNFLTGTPEA